MSNKVVLKKGKQSAYNTLYNSSNTDASTLYFTTDTGNLYLGNLRIYDASSYVDVSYNNNKSITFYTKNTLDSNTITAKTIELTGLLNADDVSTMIAAAVTTVYKVAGSIAPANVTSSHLVSTEEGNVYNLSGDLSITSGNVSLFTDTVSVGDTVPEGTNIVIINTGTTSNPVYKYDILAGLVDLSGYLKVPSSHTTNNFPMFDSNGQLVDSDASAGSFKRVQSAVADSEAAFTYVTKIDQDTQGVISATKKMIPVASADSSGLMSPDMFQKLEGIEQGAEVNIIEGVSINSVALTPDGNKVVNFTTADPTHNPYNATTNPIATKNDITDAALEWGTF